MRHLTAYQNSALAERFRASVTRVAETEKRVMPGRGDLARAVAWNYAKLLAYKDEYEVARLFTDGVFAEAIRDQFEGDFELHYHLAPPIAAQRDVRTGHLRKREFGPSTMWGFRLLARLKGLRGTVFDIFGRSEERRAERALINAYETLLTELEASLTPHNHATAVALAELPSQIRGFGHVKEAAMERAATQRAALLTKYRSASEKAPQANQHRAAE